MNKRPLIFSISLIVIIIAMFSIIIYQNKNAPPPAKEGGIIFGAAAPTESKTMNDADFEPAEESSADSASCD